MADDIERRLRALEKRAQTDDDRWQMLDADLKAFSLAIDSIGAALSGIDREMGPLIIRNLKSFEDDARILNLHASTVSRLRDIREFLQQHVDRKWGDGQAPANESSPRKPK